MGEDIPEGIIWLSGKMFVLPKMHGGLGVLNLRLMNISMLTKWLWNLENQNGLWQDIVRAKYVKGEPLIVIKKQGDSQFWRGILETKEIF